MTDGLSSQASYIALPPASQPLFLPSPERFRRVRTFASTRRNASRKWRSPGTLPHVRLRVPSDDCTHNQPFFTVPDGDELYTDALRAVRTGNEAWLEDILQRGLRIDAIYSTITTVLRGTTILHAAAYYGKPHIVRLLLSFGADPNLWDMHPDGRTTPIYWASRNNRTTSIQALLEGGAEINVQGCDLWTPLTAVLKDVDKLEPKHIETIDFLIENGASIDACGKTFRGQTRRGERLVGCNFRA